MLESTWHCTWHPGLLYGSHAGGCSRKRFSRKTCPCTSPAAPSCSCPSRCRAAAAAALHAALSSLAEPLPRVRQPTSPLYIYWILKPKITLASIILHSRVRQLLYITKPKYKCTKSARARGALWTCCMWTVNKKRHSGACATRLSAAWRWPARSQKCETPSALPFPDHWSTGSTWVSSSAA